MLIVLLLALPVNADDPVCVEIKDIKLVISELPFPIVPPMYSYNFLIFFDIDADNAIETTVNATGDVTNATILPSQNGSGIHGLKFDKILRSHFQADRI
ncbi:MAG: hypothetical protein INQ03_24120 [Candidatus Heimdallarchaeota archaeon]|nr:hypothetical protein [Candidatus Heimdallarchaeota archaeon]